MREVDRTNINLLADYFHMGNESETMDILGELGDRLHHVHVSPILPRALPFDPADAGVRDFFSALKKAGYNGTISIEAHADAPQTQLAEARICCHNMLQV